MKVYTGAPAAARHYLEAGRGRADDYYLAEGAGIARRFVASGGRVTEASPLSGDAYESWVGGVDPETGLSRGRLRTDDRATRFVEVVVNGPKSWSLAALLHPAVAVAYEAAQDRAAAQIIGWLAEHATTRVGPRGEQVQVPVDLLDAVTVRHYTSRAGDPHRHLHLQINSRVFAAGTWRGLHTIGVRDSIAAINGIGHAAVATDPQFRAAMAAHGFTLEPDGEIRQLTGYVGAFSTRAAQIAQNLKKYESEWTAAHPSERPGPALRRSWDARAWAEGRPDKVIPAHGEDLDARWLAELSALGYRDRDRPIELHSPSAGGLDRDAAVRRVLTRLGAGRSAWNTADVRAEVEQLIASQGFVLDAAVRVELAEDLTARAVQRCVPLVTRDGVPVVVPEHIRALTSRQVLAVEIDLTERLAGRATEGPRLHPDWPVDDDGILDEEQVAAASALAGHRRLLVVEGAAGAGKTTTLAAARSALERDGHHLMVVTPTLKAAKVAAAEVGTRAGSVAWMVFQHGWRWTDDGQWRRLSPGDDDPDGSFQFYLGPTPPARLSPGDLLVVDEAGMLDQDTARALLTIADETGARIALVGDRHQLSSVGRGGVLDLAIAQVQPAAHLTLDTLHRFTRADRVTPDTAYAELTLAMRTGHDPGAVFDALAARGHVQLHADNAAMRAHLAGLTAAGCAGSQRVAIVADTLEQTAQLNAAARQRLVADGHVDDTQAITTLGGQRIGIGDRIATRRNDRGLQVANRDTWTVIAISPNGDLTVQSTTVTPDPAGRRTSVTPSGSTHRVLPRDYTRHSIELAYASTAYGVQGDTVTVAHIALGAHTGAASAYVGMTRGRQSNTAHLVADTLTDARQQWIDVFARDHADLGPTKASIRATKEAAPYTDVLPRAHAEHLKVAHVTRNSETDRHIRR